MTAVGHFTPYRPVSPRSHVLAAAPTATPASVAAPRAADAAGPQVRFCERALVVGSPELGWMRDANAIRHDGAALRAQLAEDGYLLLRGLIPRELVARARRGGARAPRRPRPDRARAPAR